MTDNPSAMSRERVENMLRMKREMIQMLVLSKLREEQRTVSVVKMGETISKIADLLDKELDEASTIPFDSVSPSKLVKPSIRPQMPVIPAQASPLPRELDDGRSETSKAAPQPKINAVPVPPRNPLTELHKEPITQRQPVIAKKIVFAKQTQTDITDYDPLLSQFRHVESVLEFV